MLLSIKAVKSNKETFELVYRRLNLNYTYKIGERKEKIIRISLNVSII